MRCIPLVALVAAFSIAARAAGIIDVQDNDAGMVYTGEWTGDGSPLAHGAHETWTNQTGANVFYDFQGAPHLLTHCIRVLIPPSVALALAALQGPKSKCSRRCGRRART